MHEPTPGVDPRDPLGFYGLLGLRPGASLAEVRTAWRRLAREAHPDAGGDPDRFRLLQEAYETLSDPLRRIEYDRLARERPGQDPEPPERAAATSRERGGSSPHLRLLGLAGLALAAFAAGVWIALDETPSVPAAGGEPRVLPGEPMLARAAEDVRGGHREGTGPQVLYAVSLTFDPGAWRLDDARPPFRESVLEGLAAALGPVVERGWWIEVEATSPKVVDAEGVALDDWELALARLAAVLDALVREGVPGDRLGVRFSAGAAAELGALGTVELRLLCCRGSGAGTAARLSAEPPAQEAR